MSSPHRRVNTDMPDLSSMKPRETKWETKRLYLGHNACLRSYKNKVSLHTISGRVESPNLAGWLQNTVSDRVSQRKAFLMSSWWTA